MNLKDSIHIKTLPKHIAIIMDGNGRWAKQKGMMRAFGHENGTKSVRQTVEASAELGVEYLTLYAFSTENWNRPKYEVQTLMKLLVSSLKKEIKTLQDNNIKLNARGALSSLPTKVHIELFEVIEISIKVKNNIISPENIDESIINEHLYTQNLPDVDLLIRTSGEQRISNFLLWQIAYAELYFTSVLWPDFTKQHLYEAIIEYQKRERRFGKTSEQLS